MAFVITSRSHRLAHRAPRWPFVLDQSHPFAQGALFGSALFEPNATGDLVFHEQPGTQTGVTIQEAANAGERGGYVHRTPASSTQGLRWLVGGALALPAQFTLTLGLDSSGTTGHQIWYGATNPGTWGDYSLYWYRISSTTVQMGVRQDASTQHFQNNSLGESDYDSYMMSYSPSSAVFRRENAAGETTATEYGSVTAWNDSDHQLMLSTDAATDWLDVWWHDRAFDAEERARWIVKAERWGALEEYGRIAYFIPAAGTSPDLTTGVEFDGTNDYLTRGADLTGISDAKTGSVAFLFKTANTTDTDRIYAHHSGSTLRFAVQLSGTTGKLQILGWSSAGGVSILDVISTGTTYNDDSWHAALASWDLATATAHLYIDDVDDATVNTTTDSAIDYTIGDVSVGALSAGTFKYTGCLGELFFTTEYIDFSVEANRRDFFDSLGNPADKGSDGSTPTGTAPVVYLSGGEAQFADNFGSGGAFTETGTLVDCNIPTFLAAGFAVPSGLSLLGVGA